MNKQEREDFLAQIAEDVDLMLCGTVNRNNKATEVDALLVQTRFKVQLDTFTEKYKVYIEAKNKAETKKNQQNIQIPPDPTNPKDWKLCGLLPCYYAVLSVIYNQLKSGTVAPVGGCGWSKSRKLSDLLTKSGDTPFVFLSVMWPCIKNFWGGFSEHVINTAVRHVKKDILDNCQLQEPAETEQHEKDEQSKEISEGEWSNPMTKSEMMKKVGIDGYKKFNTFAKQYGLRPAGNRQLWQLRLDKMDKNTRRKFEKT